MAHLIKLESGDYLNLDHVVYIEHGVWMEINDDATVCYMVNGSKPLLSPKDLEKIEKIAYELNPSYKLNPDAGEDDPYLTPLSYTEAKEAGLV